MKIGLITTTALLLASSLLAPVSAKTEIIEPSENQCLQCSSGQQTFQLVQRNRNGRQQAVRRTRQPTLNQRTTSRQPARSQRRDNAQSTPRQRGRQVQTRRQATPSRLQRQQAARTNAQQRQQAARTRQRQQATRTRAESRVRTREARREARNRYDWQRYPRHRYDWWYDRPSIYWGWRSYPSSIRIWDTDVYDNDSIVEIKSLSDSEIRKRLSDQEIQALEEFAATSNSSQASETSDTDFRLRQREAEVLNEAGTVYKNQRKYTEALKYYKQALTIFKEIGDRQGEAAVLNNIGTVYKNQGNQTEALKYYEAALAIFKEIGVQGEADVP